MSNKLKRVLALLDKPHIYLIKDPETNQVVESVKQSKPMERTLMNYKNEPVSPNYYIVSFRNIKKTRTFFEKKKLNSFIDTLDVFSLYKIGKISRLTCTDIKKNITRMY